MFTLPRSSDLILFAILTIFNCPEPLYARHDYLIGTIFFVFVQRMQPDTFLSLDRSVYDATTLYSTYQYPCFSFFFAILIIFTCTKPLYTRNTYVIQTLCFVLIHRIQPNTFPSPDQSIQNATRLYSSYQDPRFLPFFVILEIFTCIKLLYDRACLCHQYFLLCFCPYNTLRYFVKRKSTCSNFYKDLFGLPSLSRPKDFS